MKRAEQVKVPTLSVLRHHTRSLIAGILVSLATFVLFYLMIVFTLSWGTTALHYKRSTFLLIQLLGTLFFAAMIPVSALLAERARRPVMLVVSALIAIFGFFLAPMFTAGLGGVVLMTCLGLALMGLTYGPLGTVISELFPTSVRYTGSSLAFSIAGILGASLAPYIATWLAKHFGLQYVGYYLAASAALTLWGFYSSGKQAETILHCLLPNSSGDRRRHADPGTPPCITPRRERFGHQRRETYGTDTSGTRSSGRRGRRSGSRVGDESMERGSRQNRR